MSIKIIFGVLILTILIWIYYWLYDLEVYTFHGAVPGPTICFVGSVHGNEPAGTVALYTMLDNGDFDNIRSGTAIIIPNPNPIGILMNTRNSWDFWDGWLDINRSFGSRGRRLVTQARQMLEYINKSDLIIDYHEGWGFNQYNPSSLGSTISPSNHPLALKIAPYMARIINTTIEDQSKHFRLLMNEACTIKTTLACYAENQNIGHVLIEITGQKNIQPLKYRVNQAIIFTKIALFYLNP